MRNERGSLAISQSHEYSKYLINPVSYMLELKARRGHSPGNGSWRLFPCPTLTLWTMCVCGGGSVTSQKVQDKWQLISYLNIFTPGVPTANRLCKSIPVIPPLPSCTRRLPTSLILSAESSFPSCQVVCHLAPTE